ncbi:hypothetical protein CYMTET_40084 [Cymbomonas tetramitiformis]|uniref:SGNH hydrolase-type esterase domain-containing protein n=1 Tax=Cymbomonas tetramitiformis TaxID=36881 RepID=A0AAE0F3V4_9CHLO|nr:hypothetical protein CYMTET_40084 [Cymbomonas tetramitiformis]
MTSAYAKLFLQVLFVLVFCVIAAFITLLEQSRDELDTFSNGQRTTSSLRSPKFIDADERDAPSLSSFSRYRTSTPFPSGTTKEHNFQGLTATTHTIRFQDASFRTYRHLRESPSPTPTTGLVAPPTHVSTPSLPPTVSTSPDQHLALGLESTKTWNQSAPVVGSTESKQDTNWRPFKPPDNAERPSPSSIPSFSARWLDEWAEAQVPNGDGWRTTWQIDQLLKGVLHRGSQQRLERVLAKLLLGHPVKVAVMGGSVSAPVNSWAKLVFDHIRKSFPVQGKGAHEFVNAAVPATGPSYGYACMESWLPPDVDLIFIEYANNVGPHRVQNPAQDQELAAAERLIRKLLRLPRQPAVLMMTFTKQLGNSMAQKPLSSGETLNLYEPYYSSGADFLERLGTYYDLPVISVRDALWAVARRSYFRQDSTRMAPEGMSTDEFCCRIKKGSQQFPFEYKESNCGCHHPNQEYGIGMMADLMIWYLRSSMSHVKMAATLLQNADPAAGATWQERMMHTIQHGTASVSEEVPDGCGAVLSQLSIPAPMIIGSPSIRWRCYHPYTAHLCM